MKLLPKSYPLAYMIFFPFMIATVYTFFFAGNLLANGLSAHWLFALIFIAMLCHKNSSLRCKVYQSKRPTWLWLLQMSGFQLSMCVIFLGFATQYQNPPNALLHQAFCYFGAFPYVLFSVLAATIAYQITLGRQPLLSSTLSPWFQNSHLDDVGSMIDTMARSTGLVCFGLLIHLCVLIGLGAINHHFNLSFQTNLNLSSLLTITFFMIVPTTKLFRQVLRPLNTFLPNAITAMLSAVLILICLYSIHFFCGSLPLKQTLQIELFSSSHITTYSALLIYLFMLSWGLFYAGFLVHISQGHSIRHMLFASLITPILFNVLTLHSAKGHLLQHLHPAITLASIFFLFVLFLKEKNLAMVMRAKLPTEPLKTRPPYQFFSSTVAFAGYFTAGYFLTGPYIPVFATIVFVVPMMLLIAISWVSFFSIKKG